MSHNGPQTGGFQPEWGRTGTQGLVELGHNHTAVKAAGDRVGAFRRTEDTHTGFQAVLLAIQQNGGGALKAGDQLVLVMPVGNIVQASVFPQPDLTAFRERPALKFCQHKGSSFQNIWS